jgi:hypothetical protein
MPRTLYTKPDDREAMIDDIVTQILEEVVGHTRPQFMANYRQLAEQESNDDDKTLNVAGLVAMIKELRHEGTLVASTNDIRAKANEIYESPSSEWDHRIKMYAATLPRS